MNISHKQIINLVLVKMIITVLLLVIYGEGLCMERVPAPTVTVIDGETGKPIEGAVAIAIWRKPSWTEGAWFEGGGLDIVKIDEAVSDSSGNIYIDGFWNWHLFSNRYPKLAIYKFGYVCWDKNIVYDDGGQTDLKNGDRIVHMKKWPEGFSFIRHDSFISTVTSGDYIKAQKHLFRDAFYQEIPFAVKEENERNKKKKECEKQK
jgi:hypothetical protein